MLVPLVIMAVDCLLSRNEFRLGNAIQAVEGGPLHVDVTADLFGVDSASRSLNASEYGNGSLRSACSRALRSSAI